ncbi:hypothetical protein HK096_000666 [Nowakowskiella sp. JEL0078]|nr:hypothetical protein HK096_000666 [Nowakowskiella sp. JEL0078]
MYQLWIFRKNVKNSQNLTRIVLKDDPSLSLIAEYQIVLKERIDLDLQSQIAEAADVEQAENGGIETTSESGSSDSDGCESSGDSEIEESSDKSTDDSCSENLSDGSDEEEADSTSD